MSEEKLAKVLSLPPKVIDCVICKKPAEGQCTHCSAFLCRDEGCLKTHIKNSHSMSLTASTCVVCELAPDGQCGYCPAPLCQNWGCREAHELKHSDKRSDEEKKNESFEDFLKRTKKR